MKAVYYGAAKTWSGTEVPPPEAAPGQVRIELGSEPTTHEVVIVP
jgi:hypothetical protein